MTIIIGTTPTINYTFSTVTVGDISVAILTIKKSGRTVIRKSLDDAVIGEDFISWTLSQEDTIAIGVGNAKVMCNWLLTDGTRGASNEIAVEIKSNHIREVISNE